MTTTGTQSGQALTRLLRAPWTSGPWLATAQVLVGLPIAALASIVVLTLLGFALSFAVTAILAAPFFAALFASCRLFTGWQRSRIEGMRGPVLPPPVTDPRVGRTFLRRLWADTRSAGTWRQVAYHCLSGLLSPVAVVAVAGAWTLGALLTTVAVYAWALPAHALLGLSPHRPVTVLLLTALGLVLLFAAPWIAELAAALDLAAVRGLLSRSREEELTVRVDTLARDREGVIDAADAQRRRLERDLHDGTQQRLVSLAMNLGMTRTTMTEVPEGVRQAIEQAHEEAKLALSELRDVVRGLHPAVLDDLGLDAALSGICARSPVPVRLLVELPRRVPRPVETAAYFVVSEALANAAKHARATQVDVVVELAGDALRIIVSDNGRGGADAEAGSGLRGLGQRIRALDGSMNLTSPQGGPTLLVVELPCNG
jgi:signal transduction histidine kinase